MALAAASLVASGPAFAQDKRPAALQRLVACRAIADTAARLACFDREVAAVDAAEARKELVVVDRDQVRSARRSLFGLTLPNLAIFGGDNKEEEGVTRLESTIQRSTQDGFGKWSFVLADGARWVQTDSRMLARDPKRGDKISIRRAALGSYLANVDGQIAIRVKRVN